MCQVLSIGLYQVHKLLADGSKIMVAIAAIWAVGAAFYIFSMPVSMHGVREIMVQGGSNVIEAPFREQSWYEAQGVLGSFWLVLLAGIYLLAVRPAWRGDHVTLAILSVIAVALSVVTGFSIGAAYMPAAFGLLIGVLLLISSRLLRARC